MHSPLGMVLHQELKTLKMEVVGTHLRTELDGRQSRRLDGSVRRPEGRLGCRAQLICSSLSLGSNPVQAR